MKKISVVFIAIMAIILTACATPVGAATQVNTTPAAGTGGSNPNSTAPLNMASQLAVGTLNLKTTSYAVTADQAATLLPLWEGLKALSSSTTFSQQEYDALVKQIQGAMSPDQVTAIDGMKLTQADIGKTMQALGLANGFGGGTNANGTPIARTPGARPGGAGGGGGRGGGGFRGGGFGGGGFGGGIPGGGGFGGGAAQSTPATQATIVARQALQAQRANQASTFLDNAVITFMQQLTGVTPTARPGDNSTPAPSTGADITSTPTP